MHEAKKQGIFGLTKAITADVLKKPEEHEKRKTERYNVEDGEDDPH